ncbi:hypothetical protein FDP41_005937 [Naegleria fowleri]|uniref:Protein kinase domain-containing protein n=1 Tax=Naegleria fowleri TaxID=5763 RepID=A0A6A5BM94_NAEFO|nr:uncharacterized protein FDP41_005937 [Naegleria fowleri]KAF0975184.1 hypothetical protein FDP41_005937 [Naegleria fowleri]CAG4710066.1 unnamed protein product [Naegleria fowleri]
MQKESTTAIYSNMSNLGALKRPLSRQHLQSLSHHQEDPTLFSLLANSSSASSSLAHSAMNSLHPHHINKIKRVKSTSQITPFYLSESFSFTKVPNASLSTAAATTTTTSTVQTPTITPQLATPPSPPSQSLQSPLTISELPVSPNKSCHNIFSNTTGQPQLSPRNHTVISLPSCIPQTCTKSPSYHDFIMNNKIMDMSSEPTLETVFSRIRYNKHLRRLVLNFEGLHVCRREHIRCVRDGIEGVILAYHPNEQNVKVQCIVNYDNYIVDDHLMDEYTENVVVYLQKYYESIERFTTNNFLQEQVRKLETALTRYRKSSIISPKVNIGKRMVGSRYVLQDLLGVGTYGRVSLAQDRETGELVAIKELSKQKVNAIGIMDWVRREIQIMKTLGRHPHICALYDVIETEETIYLILEYIEKGAIETPYDEHQQYPEELVRKYFKQMVDALYHMHNVHNICHRDFQLSNVCLDKNGNVRVCDFGCADFFTMKEKSHILFVGNSNYCSPEMLMKKPYFGPEVDVYMLGVCLYKMCTGFLPYRNAQAKLMNAMTVPLEEEDQMSDECKDILQKLLEPDPDRRWTVRQIMEHPFYKNQ